MAVSMLQVAGEEVRVTRRRDSRSLRLRVKGDGTVAVSAPLQASDAQVRELVVGHLDWIADRREKLAGSVEARAAAASPAEQAEWRAIVEAATYLLVARWEPVMGVRVGKLAFRNMTSRWGSCQPATGRVCINTRLALYPFECLEYVVVHELCHLLEPSHGARFKALLEGFLPDWREREARLRG